ncbi:hypothetical protein OnM2_020057 [Erysiphe neolycopersici]|uniref:Uncharacterized protein n=1 Tax=Erysiphe neolycopersici TaxID=212602 RepID=A0A420I3D0_9PEZI|nr:hypothetical protein OnM2_020057 [Erysiphe neolycopersici]
MRRTMINLAPRRWNRAIDTSDKMSSVHDGILTGRNPVDHGKVWWIHIGVSTNKLDDTGFTETLYWPDGLLNRTIETCEA